MKGILTLLVWMQLVDFIFTAGLSKSSGNSDITFVKIKPVTPRELEQTNKKAAGSFRTSRIENIPIQIKTLNQSSTTVKPSELKPQAQEFIRMPRSDERKNNAEKEQITTETENATEYAQENIESEARFDTSEAITPYPTDREDYQEQQISLSQLHNDLNAERFYIKDDKVILPGSFEDTKRGKAKYWKKHFGISLDSLEPSYKKYIDTRRYRTRCRCERIWNCPKLQVSVPRCPNEYFMCCF